MNRSRQVAVRLLLALAAAAIVACGATESEPSEGASAAPATETPAAEPTRQASTAGASAATEDPLGTPLEHPERYYGLYANPAKPDRQWSVTEAKRPPMAEQAPEVPPGHLAIGAMFGDVSPWHMKTLSDTRFEQRVFGDFPQEPATVQFELGSDGRATAMTFTNAQMASEGRLERVGDLPEGW